MSGIISGSFLLMKPDNIPGLLSITAARAQSVAQKDSDYDGLTDEIETAVYRTDPNNADTDNDGYLDATEAIAATDPLNPYDPAGPTAAAGVSAPASSLPWFITRAAAITSYVLMFFIIVFGEGMAAGYIYRFLSPVRAWVVHKYLGIALGVSLLVHIFSLLFDNYIALGLSDILLPFTADYRPVFLSFGIVGFYMLLIIVSSSLLIRLRLPRFWINIHYFVYPFFIFSFIHGVFIGSDSGLPLMQATYWLTGIIFFILLMHRLLLFRSRRVSTQHAARST